MSSISNETFTFAIVVFDKPACYTLPVSFVDTSYLVPDSFKIYSTCITCLVKYVPKLCELILKTFAV